MPDNLNKGNLIFQSMMYISFIIKKKYRVDEIAKKMEISKDSLYRYIRGENIIPPDRIVALIRATEDIEYLEFFCEAMNYVPIPKIKGKYTMEMMAQWSSSCSLQLKVQGKRNDWKA